MQDKKLKEYKKISSFLNSTSEQNQLIGLHLAIQNGWSNRDIGVCLIETWHGWETVKYEKEANDYFKTFINIDIEVNVSIDIDSSMNYIEFYCYGECVTSEQFIFWLSDFDYTYFENEREEFYDIVESLINEQRNYALL